MMHVRLVLFVALAFLATAPVSRAATILHLSASATVMATPDELDATLSAPATGATAAAAQAAVNELMGRAVATARKVTAVTVSTGGYATWHVTEPRAEWRASQQLNLNSKDGPALLELVGTLQANGLAVVNLSWRLAPKTEIAAREKAEAAAITKLRGRAETAAKLLGLRFSGFREVWLNGPAPPSPRPMFAAARALPEPQAIAAPTAVQARVTADVALAAPGSQ